MKAFSSAVSITAHVALGAAALLGTTNMGRSDPTRPRIEDIIFAAPAPVRNPNGADAGIAGPIVTPDHLDLSAIPRSLPLPQTGTLIPTLSPTYHPATGMGSGQGGRSDALVTEEQAEALAGPLPIYPDLLRQAGVEGRVILEAVVDTTGRVLATSIQVVTATNPGFVAPARQALLATLFRPAMVGGRPIRMRVRIPYEFAIQRGTGRAR